LRCSLDGLYLRSLEYVELKETAVSGEALEQLVEARPNLSVER
jgi:hypothetical protein